MSARILEFLLSPPGRVVRWGLSLAIGLLAGILLHFILYRIALPVQPFIYVAF